MGNFHGISARQHSNIGRLILIAIIIQFEGLNSRFFNTVGARTVLRVVPESQAILRYAITLHSKILENNNLNIKISQLCICADFIAF